MRTILTINDGWKFCKEAEIPSVYPQEWESVTLPHTWNALDGQDGGNDYWRGQAVYTRVIDMELPEGMRLFADFPACNSSGDIYMDELHLAHHDGGYSTFRVDLTDAVRSGKKLLSVRADNSKNERVYPQNADFTFYGGLYRGVNLILVPETHFELVKDGTPGMKITPVCKGSDYEVTVETWQNDGTVSVSVNGETKTADSIDGHAQFVFCIKDAHLWNGRKDPYLYTAKAVLNKDGRELDCIEQKFGCRTFRIDADEGFFLNGKSYPLRGVSRHQDRKGCGNAITDAMHEEDFRLIYEMGATSIRLAHYQHAQKFYDLCDAYGIVAWAEIPYISEHMPDGRDNTFSQMRELITQNYNHPSIVVWGLSNEITMQGMKEGMTENHVDLNDFVHHMDPTRPTTMAHVMLLDKKSSFIDIADTGAYNLYFGWYAEGLEKNGEFLDETHRLHPSLPLGFTEYGCDTNPAFHSAAPSRGDYTEEYQMVYHEYILNMIEQRPWLWCTYAWNMFDFAADARNEGGTPGVNQKGIVTMDRRIRKDVYYLYKAYWSDEPFVHVCGRRFIDHAEDTVRITVYSNEPEVSLYKDGILLETQQGSRIFRFLVPIDAQHTIEARTAHGSDQIEIQHVSEPNSAYVYDGPSILNWFDSSGLKDDCYSLRDRISDLVKNENARRIVMRTVNMESPDEDPLLKEYRADPSKLADCEMDLEHFLDLAGANISMNIRRAINTQLQKIQK